MGRISIYDSSVGGTATVQAKADAQDFGAAVGRGLQALGRGIDAREDRLERQKEQAELSDATAAGYQDDLFLTQKFEEFSTTAQPGDREAGERWTNFVREYHANKESKYTTPRAQEYQRQNAERSVNQFGTRGVGLQSALNGQKYKIDLLSTGDAVNQTVFANPDAYQGTRDRLAAEAQAGVGAWEFAKPGERPAALESVTENMAWNAGLGKLAQAGGTEWLLRQVAPDALQGKDWRGSLKTGKTGISWFDDLDPEKRIALITKADADYQQSRRLAAGNLDQQLRDHRAQLEKNGYVPNPLPRSAFSVLGDKADREYQNYLGDQKAYGLASEFIKLDDATAQARIKALEPTGAAVNEDNLRQWKLTVSAYTNLREQQARDPVGVAQARQLPGLAPIDPADDPQTHLTKLAQNLPALRDQAQITGRFRAYSNAEAEVMRKKLAGMGDDELRRHFNAVRQVIRDPAEFRAYAQQLYPDRPAMSAGAGLMHKTGMASFDEGQAYDASLVSARIFSGARYLDKKSAEGKSLRDSGLPDDDKMKKAFRGVVGDAVPPEYVDAAYDIAKSYYIGEGLATRQGLSSDKVDTKMLQRAVKLTLGNMHQNPDGSKVFAPWGMDPTRFRNEAKARYDALKAAGKVQGGFDSQSLVPVPGREGVYGIKAGNAMLPSVIDLNAPVTP